MNVGEETGIWVGLSSAPAWETQGIAHASAGYVCITGEDAECPRIGSTMERRLSPNITKADVKVGEKERMRRSVEWFGTLKEPRHLRNNAETPLLYVQMVPSRLVASKLRVSDVRTIARHQSAASRGCSLTRSPNPSGLAPARYVSVADQMHAEASQGIRTHSEQAPCDAIMVHGYLRDIVVHVGWKAATSWSRLAGWASPGGTI